MLAHDEPAIGFLRTTATGAAVFAADDVVTS